MIAIEDFPDDQGFNVDLSWYKSIADSSNGSVVKYLIQRMDNSNWSTVDSVTANGNTLYEKRSATLINSTAGYEYWTCFRIGGKLTSGDIVYSNMDSAQSLDNLPPATPANVIIVENHLEWTPNTENDFDLYSVYMNSTSGFQPAQVNLIATLDTNCYQLPATETDTVLYFRITATDLHGNESLGSSELEVVIYVGIFEAVFRLPERFFIGNNYPNPFNSETVIPCSIPEKERAKIAIYDFKGNLVRSLWTGILPSGSYKFNWDGLNNNGHLVGSGVYLFCYDGEKNHNMTKITLIK